MWRKQDEPKATTPSPEAKVPVSNEHTSAPASSPVSASVPAPTQAAPPSNVSPRQATEPAGHLTSSVVIKGEISGREDLFIDGEVQGKIRLEDGRVTIGPNGRVSADVQAREIVVRGNLKGNLNGRDRVQIGPTGKAAGDIVTRLISIEEGAEVHGRVEIVRQDETRGTRAKVAAPASADVEAPVAVGLRAKETSNGL